MPPGAPGRDVPDEPAGAAGTGAAGTGTAGPPAKGLPSGSIPEALTSVEPMRGAGRKRSAVAV